MILLDEVEKAHPDVFNVLLQVLDDGRLTDGQGRTVDFRNTVIIMTSNLGSQVIQELAGEANYAQMKAAVMEIVRQPLPPEFINRIDDIVVFHPAGHASTSGGSSKSGRLSAQAACRARHRGSCSTNAARDQLGEAGFDPVYGARPLKRAIQHQLENPLAQRILRGEFAPGDVINVSARGGALQFTKSSDRNRNSECPLYTDPRMPIYEYQCQRCGHHHEALRKLSDPQLRQCPECGRKSLKRLCLQRCVSGWPAAAGTRPTSSRTREAKRNLHEKGDKEEAKEEVLRRTAPAPPRVDRRGRQGGSQAGREGRFRKG